MRNNSKNYWEFGCSKLTQRDTYTVKIKADYKKDFNIDIEIMTDSQNNLPLPLRVYEIKSQGKIKKGVIFAAKIISDVANINIDGNAKYSDYRLISSEELSNWNEDAVEGFKDSIEAAFSRAF